MLDPRESDGGNYVRQNGFVPATSKKSTVKELLLRKREAGPSELESASSQDSNASEWKFKQPKVDASAADVRLQPSGPPPPPSPECAVQFPPAGSAASFQRMQHPTGPDAQRGCRAASPDVQLTLFHWQIKQEERKVGDLSVEQLIAQDADGDTFLHIAVAKGKRSLAYVLAKKMAECGSLDLKEHNGQTALHIAVNTDQHLITLDLLKHGAQIDARDLWGRSPLYVCAEKGHLLSLRSVWKFLTEGGHHMSSEIFSYDGLTPLHAAVLSHNAVVKEMRSMENPCGYMLMELGRRSQMYVDCIKMLLLMGTSPDTKDLKSGRTCLHIASEESNVELLDLFLYHPSALAIVNAQTFSGHTALHIVSSLPGHDTQVEAVKLLMRRGADPGARNMENELPCQLAPEGPLGEKVRQTLRGKHVDA